MYVIVGTSFFVSIKINFYSDNISRQNSIAFILIEVVRKAINVCRPFYCCVVRANVPSWLFFCLITSLDKNLPKTASFGQVQRHQVQWL